jgi:hypothetical protein
MRLERHVRRLLLYGYAEHILLDPRRLRETLALYGVTPSRGQLRATLKKRLPFILTGREPETPAAPNKGDAPDCPCFSNPLASTCGDWDGNESACVCADLGVTAATGQPLPP